MANQLHSSDSLCLQHGCQILGRMGLDTYQVFDVGANEGLFANRVYSEWKHLNLHLYCFEPNPIAFGKLVTEVEGIADVSTIPLALSDQQLSARLYHPERKTVLGSFIIRDIFQNNEKQWGKLIEHSVEVSTIDHYLSFVGIDVIHYLKIDTEGTELNVLRGASNSLENRRILCGQFEYGGTFFGC